MKLFLDTNALAYLTGVSTQGLPQNTIFDYDKYNDLLSRNEIVTDSVAIFELFNRFPTQRLHIFDNLKKYNNIFYSVSNITKNKIMRNFRLARDYDQVDELFKELTPTVADFYADHLSRIMWHFFVGWIEMFEVYNNFKVMANYDEFASEVANILLPAKNHIKKIIYKNILSLINENKFKQDNIKILFSKVADITGHYFEKISVEKMTKKQFKVKLNEIKDAICGDKYTKVYNDEFKNFKQYQEILYKDKKEIKLNPSINYSINILNDGKVSSVIRNKLLNQIEIRHNKKVTFNDIKDMLIAEHYLKFIKENKSEAIRFITFDKSLIGSLKECKDENLDESIKLVESFFKVINQS